jgi:RNA polymerase sigma-70 factor (ECF subfamily)
MTLNSLANDSPDAHEGLPPFEVLYDRYHARVYRYLHAHLKNEDDAIDLVQQVFFQAWQQGRTYDSRRGSVATWLLSIAHHRMIDFFRTSRPSVSWESVPEVLATDSDPEARVLSHERTALLRKVLETLPQSEQELLALRFAAHLSSAEIGAVIGKSEAATKKQLTRLLHRLHELYRRSELETPLPDLVELAPPGLIIALRWYYEVPAPAQWGHGMLQSRLEIGSKSVDQFHCERMACLGQNQPGAKVCPLH